MIAPGVDERARSRGSLRVVVAIGAVLVFPVRSGRVYGPGVVEVVVAVAVCVVVVGNVEAEAGVESFDWFRSVGGVV